MRNLTKSKLEAILTRSLRLRDPHFVLQKLGSRISGSIIDESFAGKRDLQRLQLIWNALDREIGSDHLRFVGMLLPYTPDEWDMPLEGRTRVRRAKAG